MTIDIANFYLATPMERYKYVKLKFSALLAEIIKEYKLLSITTTYRKALKWIVRETFK